MFLFVIFFIVSDCKVTSGAFAAQYLKRVNMQEANNEKKPR